VNRHLPPVPSGATWGGEAIAALSVGAAFLALLLAAELWRRSGKPPVEWTRKFVHMGGGVIAAFFPWVFRSHWTLLALGAAMIGLFVIGRDRGWFAGVTGVERPSSGERWFPVGVYALYVVGRHEPVFYLIALSALVVSDALAALLGTRYGAHTYPVAGGLKSIEGSAIFLAITFIGVHLPLLLLTDIGRAESVMISLQLALLATSFEAISQRGNDNLVVPLATFYLLLKLTPASWQGIAVQLAAQIALLGAVLWLAHARRVLTFAGAIAAHLVLYAAFSLGGPEWTVTPLLALAGFIGADATRRQAPPPERAHQVRAVFYVSIVAVAMLFADNSLATLIDAREGLSTGHPFQALFIGALAAPVAIAWGERWEGAGSRGAARLVAAVAGFLAVVPAGLLACGSTRPLHDAAVGALFVAAGVGYYAFLDARGGRAEGAADLRRLGASVAAAALVVTPLHLMRIGAL